MGAGLIAEFAESRQLVQAIRTLRGQGLLHLEAYTPYPIDDVEEALAEPRTITIPIASIASAFGGAALTYLLLWWINVVDLPYDVGGRPLHSAPAFVPVTWEMFVLFGGTAAFVAFLWSCGLPRPWHPVFEVEGFQRASDDRFFLAVAAHDALYDHERVHDALRRTGAVAIRTLQGESG